MARAGVRAETLFPRSAAVVTKSDTVDMPNEGIIYVGVAGDVKVLPAGSEAPVTFLGLTAGSAVPCVVRRVYNTGTTAGSLLVVY